MLKRNNKNKRVSARQSICTSFALAGRNHARFASKCRPRPIQPQCVSVDRKAFQHEIMGRTCAVRYKENRSTRMSQKKNPCADGTAARPPASGSRSSIAPNGDAIGALVSVSIDGNEVKVPMGTTIWTRARRLGYTSPPCATTTICACRRLPRVALVEVERAAQRSRRVAPIPLRSPSRSRRIPARSAMRGRHVVDLLLSEALRRPLLYSCPRNNNCELQALAKEYGVGFLPLRTSGQSRGTRSIIRVTPSSAT